MCYFCGVNKLFAGFNSQRIKDTIGNVRAKPLPEPCYLLGGVLCLVNLHHLIKIEDVWFR